MQDSLGPISRCFRKNSLKTILYFVIIVSNNKISLQIPSPFPYIIYTSLRFVISRPKMLIEICILLKWHNLLMKNTNNRSDAYSSLEANV